MERVRVSPPFVAERAGEWLGCAGVWLREGQPPQVVSMWVAPKARGQGLGRELLEAIRAWASENGHERLRLDVTNTQAVARRLYVTCGFLPTGRTEALERDPSLVLEELELRL